VRVLWYGAVPPIPAAGLTFDRWTPGTDPAAVWIRNELALPARPRLVLGMAGGGVPRVRRVLVEAEGERQEIAFDGPGSRTVLLDPLPPGGESVVLVWAKEAWQAAAPDRRWLGVHLREASLVPVAR
jgi:hypothetical protein